MDMFSKLNKYRSVIEINDFIDFLYSEKIINELNYYTVWSRVSFLTLLIQLIKLNKIFSLKGTDSMSSSDCWTQEVS